jgi:UDP-N-acetylmuramate--alanine ligase
MSGVSGVQVADAANTRGRVVFEPSRAGLGGRVRELLRPGDVVLTLGAGDITLLGRELAAWLKAA